MYTAPMRATRFFREYYFASPVHDTLRAKVTVIDCVTCLVVAGYYGADPAALSLAMMGRAAGNYELLLSGSTPTGLMTFVTVWEGQSLILTGESAPTGQLPTFDAQVVVKSGAEIVLNGTHVSGGSAPASSSSARATSASRKSTNPTITLRGPSSLS